MATVLGGVLVFVCIPKQAEEERLLAQFHAQDRALATATSEAAGGARTTDAKGDSLSVRATEPEQWAQS